MDQILRDKIFTQMLAAEAEGLITIHLEIHEKTRTDIFRKVMDAWVTDYEDGDELAEAWAAFKESVVSDAFSTFLLPKATEWLKDDLKQTSEDDICQQCQDELEKVRSDPRPTAHLTMLMIAFPES